MADSGELERKSDRRSHIDFAGLVSSNALTSFDENLFKEAALLLAVSGGRAWLQGYATMLFAAPYLLFAAVAGWLADRFPKRSVIVAGKIAESAAMILGAFGLLFDK
jgi:acyl-[acyl-carrier-protein]-phospholipid O-acyltransferase/long-chain-fatty-acid--[acyl-carrier-protein] ligase